MGGGKGGVGVNGRLKPKGWGCYATFGCCLYMYLSSSDRVEWNEHGTSRDSEQDHLRILQGGMPHARLH
jgi:hypothetical protein